MKQFPPVSLAAVLFAAVFLAAAPAFAQAKSDPSQLLMAPPMIDPANADGSRCFAVWNKAPYTVTGSINTNYYDTAAGTRARANKNFRLLPGGKQGICTYGPFYPGERIELVLRTLMPIFSCYTAAQGDIMIYGTIKPEGGTKTWAECQ